MENDNSSNESVSEAWEARNKNLKTLELRTESSGLASSLNWKMNGNEILLIIGPGLPFCGKPHYSHPLISVTSQVLSGRQNKNALDPLAEVGSKVPKVPSQEMCSTSFDGSQ